MIKLANQFYNTSLLRTTILNRRVSPIMILIIVTAIISASTEFYFLYENSTYPMFKNHTVAFILTLIAVSFIEAIKILFFRSFIESFYTFWAWVVFGILSAISLSVSYTISLSGAYKIEDTLKTPPIEISTSYKDSVNTYYSTLITNIRTNPSSSTSKKIESVTSDINGLKKDIDKLRKDKANYIDGVLAWEVRKAIDRKEKSINTLLATKNQLIVNDQSGIDAEKEIARLEQEKRERFKQIAVIEDNFKSNINNGKNNAFYYILFTEFFALVFNFIATFTNEHRAESEEEKQEKVEREINKVFNKFYNNQFPSKRKAQEAYIKAVGGSGRINDGKFNNLFNQWCDDNGKRTKKRHVTQRDTKLHENTQNHYEFTQN